jgi:hypothetical protein
VINAINMQFQPLIGFFVFTGLLFTLYQIIYSKKQKIENIYLILWIFIFWGFFILFTGKHSLAIHRYTMPAMPAFAIIAANLISKLFDKRLQVLLLLFFTINLYTYSEQIYSNYPFEQAAQFLVNLTPVEGGVIISDFSQQFYLMQQDRNQNLYTYVVTYPEQFESLLNQEYSDSMNEQFGITTPAFYYAAIKEPLSVNGLKKLDWNYHPEVYNYLKENFELVKTFTNGDFKIHIFKLT